MFEGESATVRATQDPADRPAFASGKGQAKYSGARTPYLIAAVIFALTVTFAPTVLYNQFEVPFGVASIGASFAGLLFFLIVLRFVRSAPAKQSHPARTTILQDFELTAAPDALLLETKTLSARFAWPGILQLSDDDNNLYLYTDGVLVITVPKRCFSSREEMSRFSIIVRSRIGDRA
jgi:uncharacterized integral membrane protein